MDCHLLIDDIPLEWSKNARGKAVGVSFQRTDDCLHPTYCSICFEKRKVFFGPYDSAKHFLMRKDVLHLVSEDESIMFVGCGFNVSLFPSSPLNSVESHFFHPRSVLNYYMGLRHLRTRSESESFQRSISRRNMKTHYNVNTKVALGGASPNIV